MRIAFVGNSNTLTLVGLLRQIDQTFVNDAVLAVTVKDDNDANVTGPAWPLTMDYIAASDGDYDVVLPPTAGLVDGKTYIAEVRGTGGGGTIAFDFPFKAKTRR